jgi:uncharacterized MAPEG superfamily protein
MALKSARASLGTAKKQSHAKINRKIKQAAAKLTLSSARASNTKATTFETDKKRL